MDLFSSLEYWDSFMDEGINECNDFGLGIISNESDEGKISICK